MMGLGGRDELATRLIAHGWSPETRAAIVCGASTPDEWTWTGRLADLGRLHRRRGGRRPSRR